MPESQTVTRLRAALMTAVRAAKLNPHDPAAQRAVDAARDEYLTARGLAMIAQTFEAVNAMPLTEAGRASLYEAAVVAA